MQSLLLAAALCLAVFNTSVHAQTCEGCSIACNTITTIDGTCNKMAELICEGDWEGDLCFDCMDVESFFFGFGEGSGNQVVMDERRLQTGTQPQGTTLTTSSGTCTVTSNVQTLDFFQVDCTDKVGNTAVLTVYEEDYLTALQAKSPVVNVGPRGRGPIASKSNGPPRFRNLRRPSLKGEIIETYHNHVKNTTRDLRKISTKAPESTITLQTCTIP